MLEKEIMSQLTTSTFQIGVHNIDISVPSCSCHNFIHLNMSCKHIFALTCNNFLSWDELPHAYRNQPTFTLDDDICIPQSKYINETCVEIDYRVMCIDRKKDDIKTDQVNLKRLQTGIYKVI